MVAEADIAIPPDDDAALAVFDGDTGLSPDMPLIPPADSRETAYWLRCLATAAMLHAAVFGVLNWPVADNALGGGGTNLEAISVDMVQASALQSTVDGGAESASARMARLDDREGSDRQQEAAAEAPDRRLELKPETTAKVENPDLVIPDAVVKPEPPLPELPAITIAPTKAEQPVEAPERPVETKTPPGITVAAAPSAPSEAAVAESLGGATAQGTSVVENAMQSAAIAITGELGIYARSVQQAVERNPPKLRQIGSARGEVVINFALGLDGTLLRARVLSSSGNSTLDEAALAAIRNTKFPTPPGGSQPSQLVYDFPVKFR